MVSGRADEQAGGWISHGFRTGTSLASLHPEIVMASGRIAEAVDLTKLVPAEPSLAPRPAEDTGAGDAAAATDAATI